ncbi:MAG TPA: hypothetical protein VMJ32_13770 [Pirellulales bacterium]|nr:hypothetical protein [Pirellulales bacterium]
MPPSKPPMPKNQRRAYHEAGHAVLAARFEIGIERVAIIHPGEAANLAALLNQ